MRARSRAAIVLLVAGLGCGDPSPATGSKPRLDRRRRISCVREHSVEPRWEPVVRAMCSELASHDGVSVAVAIAEGDEVIWSLAIGPRCRGRPEPLTPATTMRMGSVTKLVTAAVALRLADSRGVGLDDALPPLVPGVSLTLRSLLQHTCGLRDPEAAAMLAAGDRWPTLLAEHHAEPGPHHYANANYLVLGRWIERIEGRPLDAIVGDGDGSWSDRLAFEAASVEEPGCGHRRGPFGGWWPIPLSAEPPLPSYTRPAGGGLASVEQLVRLPVALTRSGVLEVMTTAPVPTATPGASQGLGPRVLDVGGIPVLTHAGRTGTYWSELRWAPSTGTSVAVVSSTSQPFVATTLAALMAAMDPSLPE